MKYAQHNSQALKPAGTDWEENRVSRLSIPGIYWHAKMVGIGHERNIDH